jgi:hypothetical protein
MRKLVRVIVIALAAPLMAIGFVACFVKGSVVSGYNLCDTAMDKLADWVHD